MSASKKINAMTSRGKVVGTIPSPAALAVARKLPRGAVDLFELRVDHFASDPRLLLRAAPDLPAPLIITVRHAAEGGAAGLSAAERRKLFAPFLPHAEFIDVELRSLPNLADIIAEARERRVKLIVSVHFFKSTPSLRRLELLLRRARRGGAEIFKVASLARNLPDVFTLGRLLLRHPGMPMSVMGMGEFGKLSRLLLARAGSILNYGYLDAVQIPGQWPAPVLKKRLAELG
jgi:3-dehydroquinate dehydratase-1